MAQTPEVLLPTSEQEAVAAFGDGRDVTLVGGGTIVVPAMTHGRLRPTRAVVLGRAGLAGIERDGGTVRIGATTTIEEIAGSGIEPLASAAHGVGDRELRSSATLGGNLCAHGLQGPVGDLQAPLIALGASVRSTGAGGERTEAVEEFLGGDTSARLVLDVSFDDGGRRTGYARFDRPHAHTFTILAVSVTAGADGLDDLRIAVSGAGPHAVRCPAAEAALREGGDAAAVLEDVGERDDPLASGWYRRQIIPTLVARAVAGLA